jgi:hypothetical protein
MSSSDLDRRPVACGFLFWVPIIGSQTTARVLPSRRSVRDPRGIRVNVETSLGLTATISNRAKITTALLWQEVLYGEWVTVERIGGTGTEL